MERRNEFSVIGKVLLCEQVESDFVYAKIWIETDKGVVELQYREPDLTDVVSTVKVGDVVEATGHLGGTRGYNKHTQTEFYRTKPISKVVTLRVAAE